MSDYGPEKKLGFQVVFASGEDPDYPVTELNHHSPNTKGWQSPRCVVLAPLPPAPLRARTPTSRPFPSRSTPPHPRSLPLPAPARSFCEYPQEIGLQFIDGNVQLSQVQLLSHQSKISTRIELYMGTGPEYMRCQFTRLGYLSLDSNERSAYKARELKSVYLKSKGVFMKLLLHKCHVNALNLHNQVGLVALNVLGTPIPRPGAAGSGAAGLGGSGGGSVSYLPRPGGLPAPQRCVLRVCVCARASVCMPVALPTALYTQPL